MKILVVDASRIERVAAHRQLGDHKHVLFILQHFQDASELLQARMFDVMLTDITVDTEGDGMLLALFAKRIGVKAVAVVSEASSPWKCIADDLGTVMPGLWAFIGSCEFPLCHTLMDGMRVKDWAGILDHITQS
jgi:hypothetical protein